MTDDLDGRMLRIATMPYRPFIVTHKNATHTWYTGMCMDLLDILATVLNFKYTITEPADQIWGSQLPNGTWAGMTGMLHRKEVDFALTGLSVTADRATVSDYTTGFYYDEIVLITSRPDPVPEGWTFFIRPFHWLIYLLLGCGLVVMTCILVWMERCCVKVCKNSYGEDTMERSIVANSLVQSAETLFGAMLGRAMTYQGISTSVRILLWSWCLLSLVVIATYTSKLTSNSLLTKQPLPFNSLSELVKRSDYRWGFTDGTMMETMFSTSSNKDYKLFYRRMLEFAEDDPGIRSDDDSVVLEALLKGYYVRVSSDSTYKAFKYDDCRVTVAQERLYQDTLAIHLHKGSPYTDMFNSVMHHAKETGILQYLERKWFPDNPYCEVEQTTVVPVSLDMVQTAFAMAACGLLLATLLLGWEWFVHNRRREETLVSS